jgi:hypothetical protein
MVQELAEKLSLANRNFSELEMQSLRNIAELRQTNAGLAAKSEALERRVKESEAEYKQELQILEGRHLKASREYRADSEARIEHLEQDILTLKAKVFSSQIISFAFLEYLSLTFALVVFIIRVYQLSCNYIYCVAINT